MQRLPILGLEVEGIDVLIFLGWIFRVLHRPIGTPAKPLGMLADIGMVRRALKCNIERDLDLHIASTLHQLLEFIDGAELPENIAMSALHRADRPRTAGVFRPHRQGVVRTFALRMPDRMNRRQIQHVEAHLRHIRQPCYAIVEGSMPGWIVRRRARK